LSDWQTTDFFFDQSLVEDPYPYFEALRSECPVLMLPHLGVVAVTGYDETTEVYRDNETFSSCNSVIGPFATFPVPLEGDDVGDIVDRYRDQLPMHEHMVTMDPPDHTRERGLLMRLITPKRLKDNEAFVWRLADEQLDQFLGDGQCEFISAYTQPFAMLVVADLLGVPEKDHLRFREGFGLSRSPGEVGAGEEGSPGENPLAWLDEWFSEYIEDRRRQPRKDVLTDLALATYADGTTPEVSSVVRTATFLFAAGQETSARLLAAALKHLAEHPELQDELRADSTLDPRLPRGGAADREPGEGRLPYGPAHHFDRRCRDRRRHTGHAPQRRGQPRPAAVRVPGRVPRRPRQRPVPRRLRAGGALVPGRPPGARRGTDQHRAHSRPHPEHPTLRGASWAPGARRFQYEPTWILRGLSKLYLEFDAVEAGR
jgi:cytochrome P450